MPRSPSRVTSPSWSALTRSTVKARGRCPHAGAVLVEDLAVDDWHDPGRIDIGSRTAHSAAAGGSAFVIDDPAVECVAVGSCRRLNVLLVREGLEGRAVFVV